jgi:hypothetical protein
MEFVVVGTLELSIRTGGALEEEYESHTHPTHNYYAYMYNIFLTDLTLENPCFFFFFLLFRVFFNS